ncbi:MAG: flavodoxin family protein [Desulfobacterales bacterium]
MAIKIVGVVCSPRVGQSTHYALSACFDVIRQEFEHVEPIMIDLAGMDIKPCVACGSCMTKVTCSQKDDFQKIIPVMTDPLVAGLILATPVYFGSMTAQAKAFLDRCVVFRRNKTMLRDKIGGVIAVGGFRHGGQETTIQAVHAAMLIQDMIIVGDGHATFHYGGTMWSGHPEGCEKDAFGLQTVQNLGRRVAGLAARLHDRS